MSETSPAPVRWGILGAGHIAGKWAQDLARVPGARLQAVWARDPIRRDSFAAARGAARSARTVEELLGAGDLDAVYVATPHGRHRDDVLRCLSAGLPVLCEKAFALDPSQAREMVDAARSRGLLLMEALWTRFLPGFQAGLDAARRGRIGRILSVESDFGFRAPFDPRSRLWDPAMGGGALLDIGIYPLFLAHAFLGPVVEFELDWIPAPNGVDRSLEVRATHAGGGTSLSRASFDEPTPCIAQVRGEAGSLAFPQSFHTPVDILLSALDQTATLPGSCPGNGYQFETTHFQDCLSRRLSESPLWSLDDSLALMELLGRIRDRMRSGA